MFAAANVASQCGGEKQSDDDEMIDNLRFADFPGNNYAPKKIRKPFFEGNERVFALRG